MKRNLIILLFVLLCLAIFGTEVKEPTAREIIAAYVKAMGGVDPAGLYGEIALEVQYQGHDYNVKTHLRRPHFFRNEGPDYRMIFDGQKALRQRLDPQGGIKQSMTIPDEQLVDCFAEPAFFIPCFLDFPSRYLGKQTLEGRTVYRLEVQMPLQLTITYTIDGATHHLLQTECRFMLMGKPMSWTRSYSDYRAMNGILYPHAFTFRYGEDGPLSSGRIVHFSPRPELPLDFFTVKN
jgi:hypothetical protein